MTQPSLPFEPSDVRPRRHYKSAREGRRVVETSLKAYERVKTGRNKLYRPILSLLIGLTEPAECLTAREILRALIRKGVLPAGAERNAISPRLTELLEAGCIEQLTYSKRVAGDAPAGVWRITEKGRLI